MNGKTKSQKSIYFIAGGIAVVLVCLVAFTVRMLISDTGQRRKKQVQMVTVLTPPPPPKIKEKLPEPEVQKKEDVIQQQEEQPQPEAQKDQVNDEPPPGQDLGLDAEGGSGGDSFGLKARKGGHSLIGGQFSKSSLMIKYAWYTRIIQEELQKKVNKYLEDNGGIPDGNLKAIIEITLDNEGNVLDYKLSNSSGNTHMDEAVQASLKIAKISEAPPEDMPRTLKLKISAKG